MKKNSSQELLQSLEEEHLRLQEKERYLKVINHFALGLIQYQSVEEMLWFVTQEVISQLSFEDCVIYLVDEEQQVLRQRAAFGPKNPEGQQIQDPIVIPLGTGIVGTVATSLTVERIEDTSLDERYIQDDAFRLSEISVPIHYADRLLGVIDSEHSERGFFTDEHVQVLETIAAMLATKLINAESVQKLRRYKDQLETKVIDKTSELQSAVKALEQSNIDLESFAHAISHDLQEPLRSVSGFLGLFLRRENSVSEQGRHFLSFAIEGAQRMKVMLNGLLEFSKITHSDAAYDWVDLNEVIANIKANLAVAIYEKQAIIQHEPLPEIWGDTTQLTQLFQNLISNSIKFSQDGVPPCIRITVTQKPGTVELELQDNGIGIDEMYWGEVFNMFKRIGKDNKGTGIGLAICQRIVERHGGTIDIQSNLNKGTSFRIQLKLPK